MSKESKEHLSSLMDGEITRESGLFLTRRMSSDEAMCDTWERYHLIRDCIRRPGGKLLVTGLHSKLNASLDGAQTASASAWQNHRWFKPLSGLAIAASVALMAIVVTAPQPGVSTNAGDTAGSQSVNQPFVSPNTLPLVPASQAVRYTPAQQADSNRLNTYFLRHNQMARSAGRQGFVSFVPIVASPNLSGPETHEVNSKTAESELDAVDHQ